MKEDKEIINQRLQLINTLIGHNVMKSRVSVGMSGEELGKRIGVTQQQIFKYEKGTNAVPSAKLVMIAETLEVDLLSLFKYTFNSSDLNVTNVRKKLCINTSRDFAEIQDEYEQRTIRKTIKETLDNQK